MDDARLSDKARKLIADPENTVFASAASAWEIAVTQALERLTMDGSLEAAVRDEGFIPLPISFTHAQENQALPPIHHDPFDRMLVAQARVEALHLLTADLRVLQYPAPVISC